MGVNSAREAKQIDLLPRLKARELAQIGQRAEIIYW